MSGELQRGEGQVVELTTEYLDLLVLLEFSILLTESDEGPHGLKFGNLVVISAQSS